MVRAWAPCTTPTRGPVWRYVVRLTGDRAGADDVVQETLLRAWRSPRILAQDPATMRSWMMTVARNLVIDEARSARRRHESVVAEVPERVGADDTDALFEALLIEEALATLSADHRAVIVRVVLRRPQRRADRRRARHPGGNREVAAALRTARDAPGTPGERGDAMNPDHAHFAEWDAAYVRRRAVARPNDASSRSTWRAAPSAAAQSPN